MVAMIDRATFPMINPARLATTIRTAVVAAVVAAVEGVVRAMAPRQVLRRVEGATMVAHPIAADRIMVRCPVVALAAIPSISNRGISSRAINAINAGRADSPLPPGLINQPSL